MRVGIAADHAGFALKKRLIKALRESGHEALDFGSSSLTPEDDYADYVVALARGVASGEVERGVLLWNVWEQVEAARQLIAEPNPFTLKHLKGRLLAKTSRSKPDL